MSLGTPKALDATATHPADHPAAAAQPKWDVSHREVLTQIKQDRAIHPEVKAAVAAVPVAQQQHREVPHPPIVPHPPVGQANRPDLSHVQPPTGARPDASHIAQNGQGAQWNQHPGRTEVPRQVVQGHGVGNQQLGQSQNQHPTEINRTIINNNQRYEYGNNGQHGNNNYKYLYGGLAGGALAGGAATYFGNREHAPNQNYAYNNYNNYRNWNTYNQYNNYDQYNAYDQYNTYNNYDQYALNNVLGGQYGLNQYGLNQYDQYRYPNGSYDDQFASNGSIYDPDYDGTYSNSDYLYGGTTYGGTQFDSGYNGPIYENSFVDSYRPIYRDNDPGAIVPQLFGNLIGNIIGTITSSNHHKRYYNQFDC